MDTVALMSFIPAFLQEHKIRLTRAEYVEIIRIAEGLSMEKSAEQSAKSIETIRARRKHIYGKFNLPVGAGAHELMSLLLATAMGMMMKGKLLKVSVTEILEEEDAPAKRHKA